MKKLFTTTMLVLVALTGLAQIEVEPLQLLLQQGDSCMEQYSTYQALKYYQQAYALSDNCTTRQKLANCYYKRANYHQCAELLKNLDEDSLTHEAFRQLAYSYHKQDNTSSFIYWAQCYLSHYPDDGEMVASLTNAFALKDQPQNGIVCALMFNQEVDSTNILVNRALADAYFLNRDFSAAAKVYERLLLQGDSTFNTLYSAGMCHAQLKENECAYEQLRAALYLKQMQHYGCAYRLGVVCVDTQRYEEGLLYLKLAKELMQPDPAVMKAITLSQGEGYYLTQHYPEAVAAWKEHLTYNPGSIATYYNIANAYAYLLKDYEQAKDYYQQFLTLALQEESPNEQLSNMITASEEVLQYYKTINQKKR